MDIETIKQILSESFNIITFDSDIKIITIDEYNKINDTIKNTKNINEKISIYKKYKYMTEFNSFKLPDCLVYTRKNLFNDDITKLRFHQKLAIKYGIWIH